jgi:predicted phage-related endonuclease
MGLNILTLQQGTEEWASHRAACLNASDAPAMKGVSKYQTRSELIRQKATGITREHDAGTLARFQAGHDAEASIRPHAEFIVGEPLYPITGENEIEGLRLSASSDGLTMDGEVGWEHKSYNESLAESVRRGVVPESHIWQIVHQHAVFGLKRTLFMVSDGTEQKCEFCWVEVSDAQIAELIANWKQFKVDVAAYRHVDVIPAAVATPQIGLPAVSIRVDGSISLIDNLSVFGNALTAYVERINKKPETDEDFANLEATEKTLKRAEDELDAAENSAIGQVVSVDTMRKTVALYRNMARDNRLFVGKLVKAEKENRKTALVASTMAEFRNHLYALEDRIGGAWMPRQESFSPAADVIKGLKTLDSMRDRLSVWLANTKVQANEVADRIERNHKSVEDTTLVPDFGAICQKSPEDFAALMGMRKMQRAESEEKRIEAERARIRAEEQAKAEREAKAKARAEQAERDAVAALEKEQWESDFKAAQKAEEARELSAIQIGANDPINDTKERLLGGFNQDVRKVTEMPDTGATMSLGKIAARLGFAVSADFLAQLGIKVHAHDKNAKLYLERDFPMICAALVRHIQSCAMREAQLS